MKKRFALVAMLCIAGLSNPILSQVKGLNKEEVEDSKQQSVAPDGREFQVSPDGKMVAFFAPFKDVSNVFVTGINGGERKQVSFVGDAGVESFYWLNGNLIAFVTARGTSGSSALYVGDFGSAEFRRVSAEGADVRVIAVSSRDGYVNYEMNSSERPNQYDYYLFSTENMSSKLIADNSEQAIHWAPNQAGGASFSYAYQNGAVQLINELGEKFVALEKCMQFKPLAPSIIHKGSYYCLSDNQRNGAALVEINLTDGKEKEVLFSKEGSSVERVLLTPKSRKPVMVWYRGKDTGHQLIDKTYAPMMEDIKSKVKGAQSLQLIGCSDNENVWIVLNDYGDTRKAYYRYNVANKDIRQLNEVDLTYELKIAKTSTHTITDTRGKEMVLRFYSPPVVDIKYPTVLVFGEGMWALNSPEHDTLLMVLGVNGFPVLEVDLLHSQSYGAAAFLNGYEWWSNMLISDMPIMLRAINQQFSTSPGVVPFGIGIGAEMALHAMSLYPDMKMRSVLLQPYFSDADCARDFQRNQDASLRFILKGDEQSKEKPAAYLGAAANPMVIYSTLDADYAAQVNDIVQSLAMSGNSPVVVNYGDDYGIPKTPTTRAQVMDEMIRYIGAVPVKKVK
ncbi:MAG: TolB family protein [Flavobacteriales bacterium]